MARRILSWLEENWPQSTPFLAIYSAAALFLLRDRMDLALMLIWLQTPVYFLHQFEEYIYPGGFLAFFNRKNLGSQRSDFPLTQTMSLWINVPVIFIGFPVSAYLAGRFGLSFGLWAVYFSVVNGLAHVIMFFRFGYNPGLFASVALNIPIGIFTIGYFLANGLASGRAHAVGLLVAVGLHAMLIVLGFLILKPKIKAG